MFDDSDSVEVAVDRAGYEVEIEIVGKTSLGFGAPFQTQASSLEGGDAELEKNYWRERIPVNTETGNAMINPMALKKALDCTAKQYLGRVPGKGRKEYGKYFKCGVQCTSVLDLGIKPDKIQPQAMYVALPGQGRHWKNFPKLDKWSCKTNIRVVDSTITEDVLKKCIEKAGETNGLGLFRPQNGGYWGTFTLKSFKKV